MATNLVHVSVEGMRRFVITEQCSDGHWIMRHLHLACIDTNMVYSRVVEVGAKKRVRR